MVRANSAQRPLRVANSFDVTTSTAAVTDWAVVPAHAGIEALAITKLEITAAAFIFRIFMNGSLQHLHFGVSQFSLVNNQLLIGC